MQEIKMVLHCAVFAKSLENVKVLLRSGAEVNATQYVGGCTPLHSACKIGAGVAIIKELVKAGAEVNQLNKYGATPMYYIWESEKYCLCDSKESEKASKFLREQGGITKSRELTCYGIERLVGEIADMLNGVYMPEVKIIEIGEIRKKDKSLIKEECKNLASKIISQVNEMIDEGGENEGLKERFKFKEKVRWIMLKLGKKETFNKSAKELLENSYKNIYARDEKGRTVLHYAVDAKTVRLLVEKGANVNAADVGGYTALHLAVTEKRLEIVKELIKSGGNVNAEEYGNKCTLLHLACMVGEKEIVEELVKAGGEIEQADRFGMTAMDYAKNSKEVTEVLKKEIDKMESLLKK